MIFTNISGVDIYLSCCHRSVTPGSSFSLPWSVAEHTRIIRMAMSDGVLAWKSEACDPEISGSPDADIVAKREKAEEDAIAEELERSNRAIAKQMEEDDRAVAANMANMGNFDVPTVTPLRTVNDVVEVVEEAVTDADVIKDDHPISLADIRRHNKAVKRVSISGVR